MTLPKLCRSDAGNFFEHFAVVNTVVKTHFKSHILDAFIEIHQQVF